MLTDDCEIQVRADDKTAGILIDPPPGQEGDCLGVRNVSDDRPLVVLNERGRRIGEVRPGQRASFVARRRFVLLAWPPGFRLRWERQS